MNKTEDDIKSWESGKSKPTYVQLEKMAYKIYHRPVVLFFFPNVPDEDRVEHSFRTLPDTEIQKIPPKIHLLLRKAKVMQMNLTELSKYLEESNKRILYDLNFEWAILPIEIANRVRSYFGIDITEQKSWLSTDVAFKHWRTVFEKCGIFVFKDSFSSKESNNSPYSGFCLHDYNSPIIYTNSDNPSARQIFSLFHELAHLLMQTSGVDSENDNYIEQFSGNDKAVELLCNQFAVEILIPTEDFNRISFNCEISEGNIQKWAIHYHTSRETILRKLLDQNRITKYYYEKKSVEWSSKTEKYQSISGGNCFSFKYACLSKRYLELVFHNYHRNNISVEKVAEYLDIKVKHVSKMEELLYRKIPIEE